METLRFLMVTTFYPPLHLGGDAVHVRYLSQTLAARGHEVHVEYAPAAYRLKRSEGASEPPQQDDGVRLHPIPSPWGRLQPVRAYLFGRTPSVTRFHEELVRDLRPDVVHYHNISLLGLGPLAAASRAQSLYTAHDYWAVCPRSDLFKYGKYPCDSPECFRCTLRSARPPRLWDAKELRKALKSVDWVVAPSRFIQERLAPALPCPTVHLPNFAPDPNPPGRVELPGNYYLFVGVHEPHKGAAELAKASIMEPSPVRVVFVGKGTEARRIRRFQARGYDNLETRGWVTHAELQTLYRRARALVIPSLWPENAPLAALEALAWGVPLLVSRRGGLEELLQGGLAGTGFDPSPAAMRACIDAFEPRGVQIGVRKKARRAYETRHRPETYLARYLKLLDWTGSRTESDLPLQRMPTRTSPLPPLEERG